MSIAAVPSCKDIMLDFLSDAGDDWTDGFMFKEPNLNFGANEVLFCNESHSNFDDLIEGTLFDENGMINWDVDDSFDSTDGSSDVLTSDTCSSDKSFSNDSDERDECDDFFTEVSDAFIENAKAEKRKRKGSYVCKKKTKLSPSQKVKSIVSMLKELQKKKLSEGIIGSRYDPLDTLNSFLILFLCTKMVTAQNLLRYCSQYIQLSCKAISSLYHLKQKDKAYNAYSIVPPTNASFPVHHSGVGHVNVASRGFMNAIGELLAPMKLSNLTYKVDVPRHLAMLSWDKDQLTTPFFWSTEGMISAGYPAEIEFSGLIRCTFKKKGILSVSMSFDPLILVRQCNAMTAMIPKAAESLFILAPSIGVVGVAKV